LSRDRTSIGPFLLLAFSLLVPCLTKAQDGAPAEGGRVLLWAEAERAPFTRRLEGELRSRGFEVVVRAASGPWQPADLLVLAADQQAVAVLALVSSEQGVAIWVIDRITNKTVMRQLVGSEGEDPDIVARRAVEVLRASLLEVLVVPAETLPEAPTSAALDLVAPTATHTDTSTLIPYAVLGARGSWAPDGFDPSLHIDLALGVRVLPWLRIAALGRVPIVPTTLHRPEGRIEFLFAGIGAGIQFRAATDESTWDLWIGAQGLTVWAQTRGAPAPDYLGATVDGWTGLLGIQLAQEWRLTPSFALYVSGALELAAPTLRMAVGDRRVASWGLPLSSISIGVLLAVL
jgi:hypothetical protein